MRVSRKNKKVTIQEITETRNSYGESIETWVKFKTVWANIAPISGKEFFNAQTISSKATLKITVNYIDGLTHKKRILHGDRIFNIENILNKDERNRELVILVSENVD